MRAGPDLVILMPNAIYLENVDPVYTIVDHDPNSTFSQTK